MRGRAKVQTTYPLPYDQTDTAACMPDRVTPGASLSHCRPPLRRACYCLGAALLLLACGAAAQPYTSIRDAVSKMPELSTLNRWVRSAVQGWAAEGHALRRVA